MSDLNEGLDNAQFTHDNESPPEGESPRCEDCGELLDSAGWYCQCDSPSDDCYEDGGDRCNGCGDCYE